MVSASFASSIGREGQPSHVTKETTLLERARAYDTAAVAELYDRHAPRMYAYIYRRVGDAALAEDLTSELFLRMLKAIQGERPWHSSFRAWLYRIAHNLVVDHYRRRSPAPSIPLDEALSVADQASPVETVERALDDEELGAAVRQLTAVQQEALALRFGEGLTARETAQVMGRTTGAVEALQRRALAALRRILAGEEIP